VAKYAGRCAAARSDEFVLLPDPIVPGGLVLERLSHVSSLRYVRTGSGSVQANSELIDPVECSTKPSAQQLSSAAAATDEFADLERDLITDLCGL
jgi:hypothetical protein